MHAQKYPSGFPWVQQFRKHSWWLSPAKQRTFVIAQVWHNADGSVEACELLEYKTEITKRVELAQLIEWLNTDQLQPISSMPV